MSRKIITQCDETNCKEESQDDHDFFKLDYKAKIFLKSKGLEIEHLCQLHAFDILTDFKELMLNNNTQIISLR